MRFWGSGFSGLKVGFLEVWAFFMELIMLIGWHCIEGLERLHYPSLEAQRTPNFHLSGMRRNRILGLGV